MIQQLVELAERLRNDEKDQSFIHDAFCKERVDAYIYIKPDGTFLDILSTENKVTFVEDLVRTENKGRTSNVLARLLMDNEKYVLGLPEGDRAAKCLEAFKEKLKSYRNVQAISPVIKFYERDEATGLHAAQEMFKSRIGTKQLKTGTNFLFLIRETNDQSILVHADEILIDEIKKRYDEKEKSLKGADESVCSICGQSEYRVRNLATHGIIDGVLPRNSLGNYLVSFEGEVFSSYGLEGNDNSMICTHCAKAYVDALNWLLAPYSWLPPEKGKKPRPLFKNRKDISNDTAVVFWLENKVDVEEIAMLDEPNEEEIRMMLDSVYEGRDRAAKHINSDIFFAITLSGSAARIAVRDWIETSVENLRMNIVQWFRDIEIAEYNSDEKKLVKIFPRFWELVHATKNKSGKDVEYGRIGAALWKSAVLGSEPPLRIISSVLNRIRAEQGNITSARIALLKFCLNRITNHKGGTTFMAALDESNTNSAYICGQIFAVLESIQYYASGGNLNAGIRERFFSSASTTPSTAFGRLFKLSQKHLSKIIGEKPGLAVNLDKQLQELVNKVRGSRFPVSFSLEDQASFAIGYYHQRQKDFENKTNNKEN